MLTVFSLISAPYFFIITNYKEFKKKFSGKQIQESTTVKSGKVLILILKAPGALNREKTVTTFYATHTNQTTHLFEGLAFLLINRNVNPYDLVNWFLTLMSSRCQTSVKPLNRAKKECLTIFSFL